MFAADDAAIVGAAVKALMLESRSFAPGIGEVKAKMRMLTRPSEPTEAEAWGMVCKALRRSGYLDDAREAFDGLPAIVRRVVGDAAQLREWANMDSDTVHSVIASNFQRSYRVAAAQAQEYHALPPDVKDLVAAYHPAALPNAAPDAHATSHGEQAEQVLPREAQNAERGERRGDVDAVRAVIQEAAAKMRMDGPPVEDWRPPKERRRDPEREAELRARRDAMLAALRSHAAN